MIRRNNLTMTSHLRSYCKIKGAHWLSFLGEFFPCLRQFLSRKNILLYYILLLKRGDSDNYDSPLLLLWLLLLLLLLLL